MKTKEPISVNGAQITTVTVDIQVIRIGSKQMTLTVFRQLRHKNIFNSDGTLCAPPWGWVNYDRREYGSMPFVFSHQDALYCCDVNLQQNRGLELKPGSKWILEAPVSYGGYSLYIPFESREEAETHLENRFQSIAVLEAAPQLFIAV